MNKILIVASEFPPGPGGIGTHAYELAKGLLATGWQVQVLANQDYASPDAIDSFNHEQKFGINHFGYRHLFFFKAYSRYRKLIKTQAEFRPDIILGSGLKVIWLLGVLKKRKVFSQPTIAIGHGGEFGMQGLKRKMTLFAYHQMDAVICVSRYTKKMMEKMRVKNKEKLVIHNGANDQLYKVLESKNFQGEENRGPILLTVGHLCERKGQDIVVKALQIVKNKYPNVVYRMIGLETKKESLLTLAKNKDVEKNIEILGRLDSECVVKHLNQCDLNIMTSRHSKKGDFEGFGIAVIEAALCEKPSIVANNSGLEEAVIDNKTGLVISENNVNETAKAILYLLENKSLRESMGRQARIRAQESYTWRKVVAQYSDFLNKFV